MQQYFRIGGAAKFLGISADTLRRWDKNNIFKSSKKTASGYRYYSKLDLVNYLNSLDITKLSFAWAKSKDATALPQYLYCQFISDFAARLPRLESTLQKKEGLKEKFSLITAIASEIGNNSFDHNLGNWSDIPGIFFGYDIKKRIIVLADRGQGILKTLKRVRRELKNGSEALAVAFTEVISGRSPESRGNGLKYVKKIITTNDFKLKFQTGNAVLKLEKGDTNLNILVGKDYIKGCLAVIRF